MRFTIYQESRIGRRATNQDRIAHCYSREALLMLVADLVNEAEAMVSRLRNAGTAVRPLRPESLDELLSMLAQQPGFRLVEGRVETAGLVRELADGVDVIVHLAAQAGVRHSIDAPRSYVEANLIGTFEVLEAVTKVYVIVE